MQKNTKNKNRKQRKCAKIFPTVVVPCKILRFLEYACAQMYLWVRLGTPRLAVVFSIYCCCCISSIVYIFLCMCVCFASRAIIWLLFALLLFYEHTCIFLCLALHILPHCYCYCCFVIPYAVCAVWGRGSKGIGGRPKGTWQRRLSDAMR